MKILEEDPRAGLVRVRVDTLDDLWHLSRLVRPGDLAAALTYRTPEEASKGKERAAKVEKKAMLLTLKVESVEFHEFSNRLRLLGVIVGGPQDHGQHHTLNVEPLTEIAVQKGAGWSAHERERLREAVAETLRPQVVFLSMEENEAVVALLRAFGVQKAAEVSGHVAGKRYADAGAKSAEGDFFDEIVLALREKRPEGAPLLVVGPGFAKERFVRYAAEKAPDAVRGAAVEGTGQAGMAGVHEALKRGMVERVAKEQRVSVETRAVERLLEAIAKDEPATYGFEQVSGAIDRGAVELLLVTDEALRARGDALIDRAKGTGANAQVISTLHDAGRQLQALGGVAAILRYRLDA